MGKHNYTIFSELKIGLILGLRKNMFASAVRKNILVEKKTIRYMHLKVNLKQRARKGKILQNFALSKIENRFSFHEKSIFFKSDKKSIKYKLNAIRNAANYRIAPKAR